VLRGDAGETAWVEEKTCRACKREGENIQGVHKTRADHLRTKGLGYQLRGKSGIETNPIHWVGHRRESLIMLRARISSPFQATNIKDPSVALETSIEEQLSCNRACYVMLNRYEALSVGSAMLAYMDADAA
jgi:hypothetical protein